MHLPHFPILAAADLQEVIFVIVFLVVGFLQWLFSLLKQKKADAERANQPAPSEEELEARRQAWEEQTRPVEEPARPTGPPMAPRPTASKPGSLGDLMETLRRTIEEVNNPNPAAPPPPPARPPALPPAPQRASREEPTPAAAPSWKLPPGAVVAQTASVSNSDPIVRRKHPLTDMLRTTHGYQQAFILREVLGPCKALENEPT